MAKFNYGDAHHRFPIEEKPWALEDGKGILQVHDIYNPLPDFMREADMVITDLPYNQAMATGYYTKAELEKPNKSFEEFYKRLFSQIDKISPDILFVQIGKQNIKKIEAEIRMRYEFVEVFNVFYHKTNPCFFVRASRTGYSEYNYEGLDEMDVIELACANEDYEVVADPLMGQGAVAVSAYKADKAFLGTELNKNRLAVTLEKVAEIGGKWKEVKK